MAQALEGFYVPDDPEGPRVVPCTPCTDLPLLDVDLWGLVDPANANRTSAVAEAVVFRRRKEKSDAFAARVVVGLSQRSCHEPPGGNRDVREDQAILDAGLDEDGTGHPGLGIALDCRH